MNSLNAVIYIETDATIHKVVMRLGPQLDCLIHYLRATQARWWSDPHDREDYPTALEAWEVLITINAPFEDFAAL